MKGFPGLTVVLVSDDVGENDVLDLGGVDAELLVDFDEEVESERLVVEGRSSSAHERSWERSDVLLGSGEEVLLAVCDVVAEGSLNLFSLSSKKRVLPCPCWLPRGPGGVGEACWVLRG